MEEKKFVCKYCSKRFVCGKSLGGHIRTHMMSERENNSNLNANSNANSMIKFDDKIGRKRKREFLGSNGSVGDDGNLVYGLRENPKKTTRFVHSNVNSTVPMEKFCKECGKGFPSLKALCGHMACHSDKGVSKIESGSGVSEKHKLVMDSQSDTETSVPMNSQRLKRMKFKNVGSDNQVLSSSSVHWGNCSSSLSEVEPEQEEVARSLMMMSRDLTFKGRFALVTESSDNNSIVLEAKSKSPSVGGTKNNACGSADKKLNRAAKMKSVDIGYISDNSDSGYFTYGPRKLESDDSSDEFFRHEFESRKVENFSGFEDHDFESNKKVMSRGRKRSSSEAVGKIMIESSSKNTKNGYRSDEEINEGLKIERNNDSSDDSAYESDKNSTESDSDSYQAPKTSSIRNMNGKSGTKKSSCKGKKKMKSKKNKDHVCPLCNKIFRSGQALGGHKRSHFIGGYDENTLMIRPNVAQAAPAHAAVVAPRLLDLNLPAPVDE